MHEAKSGIQAAELQCKCHSEATMLYADGDVCNIQVQLGKMMTFWAGLSTASALGDRSELANEVKNEDTRNVLL